MKLGHSPQHRRSAIVLVAVLVVIVILTLAAYQFSELMNAESRGAQKGVRTHQARSLADSGIHYCIAMLSDRNTLTGQLGGNPYDNPSAFRRVPVPTTNGLQGYFSIVAVDDSNELTASSLPTRYGVTDEAGKINLNTLLKLDSSGKIMHDMLMRLPNMTETAADSIIDWIDTDETTRTNGAESQFYSARSPAYRCKNALLDSLEELLLVRGVTPALLFGTDRNRNGLADSGESGTFDRGWLPYLTIYSRELNRDTEGNPRIFLNSRDLTALNTQLQGLLSPELANFVIAVRLYGPSSTSNANTPTKSGDPAALANVVQQALSSGNARARFSISSPLDLVTAQVTVPQANNQPPMVFRSPLADSGVQRQFLPILYDKFTTQRSVELPARINVNTAPRTVLATLPGLTETDIQTILDRRPSLTLSESADPIYQTPAWLLTEANINPIVLRALERYVTTRTQVYRIQAIGYFDGDPTVSRVEAVVDTNQGKPRIVYYRDLSELGRGFDVR